jgi:uncharacterized protein (UPF0335 family)
MNLPGLLPPDLSACIAALVDKIEELEKRLAQVQQPVSDRLRRMSLAEASERCGYPVKVLKQMIRDGQLGHTKFGELKVSEADLEEAFQDFYRAKQNEFRARAA